MSKRLGNGLPVAPGAQVVQEDVQAVRVVGRRIVGRGVRADDQVRRGPQAVTGRDRLRREHVQHRARQMILVEQVAQRVLVEQFAAADVDQAGAGRQAAPAAAGSSGRAWHRSAGRRAPGTRSPAGRRPARRCRRRARRTDAAPGWARTPVTRMPKRVACSAVAPPSVPRPMTVSVAARQHRTPQLAPGAVALVGHHARGPGWPASGWT